MNTVVRGKAWRVTSHGDPAQVVQLQEMAWPEPGHGHILIRVRTAGAGHPDQLTATGHVPGLPAPPLGVGAEAAGEVVATAPRSAYRIGDQVLGLTAVGAGWGGFADYTYLREQSTIRIPEGMSDEEAGGFAVGFRTAYAGLVDRAPVEKGQYLVVLGAAGSTGATAVQLGRALGAHVVAVAGGPGGREFCRRCGAEAVLDRHAGNLAAQIRAATGGHGADLIYDPVGGTAAVAAMGGLVRNGRIALIGVAGGLPAPIDPLVLLFGNLTAIGVYAGGYSAAQDEAAWEALARLARDGRIRTPVGAVHSFADVPDLLATLDNSPPGKAVVRVAV
ncbi:zinc-binding dehydrogenase [Actinoplanes sp. RD1]|uniref:zinc-binding dehydrogenase n=1 Tax=Actinoplanes sp. RD1 TaxID=3064538 RepID=UPI00274205F8|nr:zinc-binding dehydrogenase [Actinoplanes sp. RD1]